jgi:xanthine/uracil permease
MSPLSAVDAEYLKKNSEFADKHSFVVDGIFLVVFVVIIARSIRNLSTTELSSFQYKAEIAASIFSLGMIIYISVHLSIKVKVEKLRNNK